MSENNISVERDLSGTLHIKVGEFDFIQIQYQYPHTDNASTRVLADRIVALLAQPAEAEGEFGAEQWWFAELDAALSSGTVDQRRALAVVRNLLGQFAAVTAERDQHKASAETWGRNTALVCQERDQLRAEVEALQVWRNLAMQFDRNRMTALGHLKAVVANPNAAAIQAAQAFLEDGPVLGPVVELLIAADAIERIVHYVVSKGDQDVLRRIVLEKRREAGLEVAMAAKEG